MKETILDKYALDQLSDENKAWLAQTLAQDPSFQQELDIHAEIVKGMIHYCEQKAFNQQLKAKIGQIDTQLEQEGFFATPLEKNLIENIQLKGEQELKNSILNVDQALEQEGFFAQSQKQEKKPIIRFLRIFVAAASIILMVTMGWQWMARKSINPQEQYALAFQPYQNILSKSIQLELSEYGFGGNPNKESLNQLLEAMNAYDAQDYTKANTLLSTARKNGMDQSYQFITQFYLALSYMGSKQEQKAIPLLEDLIAQKTTHQEANHWYLGLAYLKQENLDKAKKQFLQLTTSKVYGERVNLLIQQL